MDVSVAESNERLTDRQHRLRRVLAPESIAFIGGGWVELGIEYCRQLEFEGQIAVVNPKHDHIAGIPCVKSVDQLPFVPDAAFVCVNKHLTLEVIPQLRELDVPGAICNAGGFSEIGAEGEALQRKLEDAAGEMLLFGPNCPGFVNFQNRAAIMMERFGVQPPGPGVAMVTQGGGIMIDLLASDRDLALTHMIGLGNQADVTIPECIDFVLDDPNVRAVMVYVERMPDIVGLSNVAIKALAKGIPIVALKSGASDAGSRATLSHTASMTSPNDVVEAVFSRLGIIQAKTITEMVETLKFITIAGIPKGFRTAIMTASGMHSALAGDSASNAGLDVTLPSDESMKAQKKALPSIASAGNPLDLSTTYWGQRETQAACYKALVSGGYDIAVQIYNMPKPGGWDPKPFLTGLQAFVDAVDGKDVKAATVTLFPECIAAQASDMLRSHGIAPLQGLEESMGAIANAARHREQRVSIEATDETFIRIPQPKALGGIISSTSIDEHRGKEMLDANQIPIPRGMRIVGVPECHLLVPFDGPYVVKALSNTLFHKSDVGGVRLNIKDASEIRDACIDIKNSVENTQRGTIVSQFLIEEQVSDTVFELCIGVTAVDRIGHAMTISAGGTMTELLADTQTILLPASRVQIEAAFVQLAVAKLCDGYRGKPMGDRTAMLDAIERIGRFAFEHRDHLIELEINPLLVKPNGHGVAAVDVVLRFAEEI